jgi:hypothetical protein
MSAWLHARRASDKERIKKIIIRKGRKATVCTICGPLEALCMSEPLERDRKIGREKWERRWEERREIITSEIKKENTKKLPEIGRGLDRQPASSFCAEGRDGQAAPAARRQRRDKNRRDEWVCVGKTKGEKAKTKRGRSAKTPHVLPSITKTRHGCHMVRIDLETTRYELCEYKVHRSSPATSLLAACIIP